MSVLELAEVVNPHFAVPVVGVVICAVLVFAFGFKSSVQPPSFDFENKHRSRPKPSKKGKKPQSNGHVVAVETAVAPGPKPVSPKPVASPKSSPPENTPRVKAKKISTTPKPGKTETAPVVRVAKEQEPDSGEWMTAKTRKRKSKKDEAKKDDGSDSSPEANKTETTPEPEAKPEIVLTPAPTATEMKAEAVCPPPEPPLEKRASRKERKKKDTTEKPTAAPAQDPPPQTTADLEPEKKEVTEPEIKTSPAEDTAAVEEDITKPSPKKNKKKKAKAAPVTPEVVSVKEAEPPVVEVAEEVKSEEEKDPIQAALEDAAADDDTLPVKVTNPVKVTPPVKKPPTPLIQEEPLDFKDLKSPKKKKKSKDSRDKYPEPGATASQPAKVEEPVASPAQSSIETNIEGATSRISEAEVGSESPTSDAPSIEAAKSTKTDQSPVTFDELGEWQEARTVKRKKRPRREN